MGALLGCPSCRCASTRRRGGRAYIAQEIVKWQRFEKASFVWDSAQKLATFSAEVPLARSAKAAVGEAQDAMENMLYAAVREPGAFTIRALKAEFISDT